MFVLSFTKYLFCRVFMFFKYQRYKVPNIKKISTPHANDNVGCANTRQFRIYNYMAWVTKVIWVFPLIEVWQFNEFM